MISIQQALAIVLENTPVLPAEGIDFANAAGRLLREDVASDLDMPPFPRSAVDGYALRAEDVATPPEKLRVIETIPAGKFPERSVGPGEAAQIMTGAPVPDGADAVQMVEQTRGEGDVVEVLASVHRGQNVAPRGSEVRTGDVVLRAGTRLDPPAVAVAATVGKTRLAAGRKPKVSVIATGDELVHPSKVPGASQIRNSNGFSLLAQCAGVGIEASYLGVAKDTEASLNELIGKGLEGSDVLLLSGGVSMGRFDLVEGVLESLGVRRLIEAIALKPGKPLVFAVAKDGKLVFGLPGNPVSTMVTFELFVRTALARMEGAEEPVRPLLRATLQSRLASKGPRRAYLPGWVRTRDEDGALVAFPIPTRGSGDIVAFSKANALLIVPEESEHVESGDSVAFHPLDSFLAKEDRWAMGKPPCA